MIEFNRHPLLLLVCVLLAVSDVAQVKASEPVTYSDWCRHWKERQPNTGAKYTDKETHRRVDWRDTEDPDRVREYITTVLPHLRATWLRHGRVIVAMFASLAPLTTAAPIHLLVGRECQSEGENCRSGKAEDVEDVEVIGVTVRCPRRISIEAPVGGVTRVASIADEQVRMRAVPVTASHYVLHNGFGLGQELRSLLVERGRPE